MQRKQQRLQTFFTTFKLQVEFECQHLSNDLSCYYLYCTDARLQAFLQVGHISVHNILH